MIVISMLMLAAVALLAVLVWRVPPQQIKIVWLVWVAIGLLLVYALFWTIFAVVQMFRGDFGAAMYLVPAAAGFALAGLTTRRPLAGGMVMVTLGVAAAVLANILTGGLPFLLIGGLLLAGTLWPKPAIPDSQDR